MLPSMGFLWFYNIITWIKRTFDFFVLLEIADILSFEFNIA